MSGESIASQALGHAGPRRLPTEQSGPRPRGVRADSAERADAEDRRTAIDAEALASRATRA